MSQVLTQAGVGKLTTTTRRLVSDGRCKGLYVDVRPTNRMYVYRYTDCTCKQRCHAIGPVHLLKLSEARQMAYTLARRLALGENIRPQNEAGAINPCQLRLANLLRKDISRMFALHDVIISRRSRRLTNTSCRSLDHA